MMEQLIALKDKILEFWNKYTSKQKTIIICVACAILVAIVLLAYFMTRHECLSGARPGLVDRLREDLLARSGLAGEQYRRVRRSDFALEVHGLSERLRRTDDAVERMFVGEFRLETRQSALHPRLLRRTAQ